MEARLTAQQADTLADETTMARHQQTLHSQRPRRPLLLLAIMFVLTVGACTQEPNDSPLAAPSPSTPTTDTAVVEPSTPLPLVAEVDLLDVATRDWATLLATTLDDPLWVEAPTMGPEGLPTTATASEMRARIWTYLNGSWGVTQTIELPDQYILESSTGLPTVFGQDVIVPDATGNELRFLLPTAYANGPAVAAIGHDGTAWVLLSFVDQYGEWPYIVDAEIRDGTIIVWHNDCLTGCATGTLTPLGVTRIDGGYRVDDPPPTPPAPVPGEACEPGSFPDCVDQYDTGDWRYIVGWAQCVTDLGPSGPCEDLDEDGYAGYPDTG